MKNFYFVLIHLIFLDSVRTQQFIFAPDFNFKGTKTVWFHRPVEVSDAKQVGPIIHLEALVEYVNPIVIDRHLYFLLDNVGGMDHRGTTLICYDHITGDTLWQKNYNAKFYKYGYTYWWDFRRLGDNIEMFGWATIDTVLFNNLRLNYAGFTTKRIIDKDGHEIENIVNLDPEKRIAFQQAIPPIYFEGKDHAFFYSSRYSNDTARATDLAKAFIWDDTLSWWSEERYDVEFKEPNSANGLRIQGPVQLDPNTFVFFGSFYFYATGSYKHYMWTTNALGKPEGLKEISDVIGRENFIGKYENSRGQIRLGVFGFNDANGYSKSGYVYLNGEGQLIKDQKILHLNGKNATRVSSLDLSGTKDILHVIRFIEDNNIYFYLEKEDGIFLEVGSLINQNKLLFAFLPVSVLETNERDIIVTFSGVLDTLANGGRFLMGGWPYICKIDGRELSLVSKTDDKIVDSQICISPNPTDTHLKIEIPSDQTWNVMSIEIANVFGKIVHSQLLNSPSTTIDLHNLTNGQYMVNIFREQKLICTENLVVLR